MNGGYISPDEIIADATSICDDEAFKKFSYGSYLSQIQQALTELAQDTLYDDRVWSGPIPSTLVVDITGVGVVNIEKVFLYNGDKCHAGNQVTVWHARGFTRHKGAGFKEQKGSMNNDPIMDNVTYGSEQGLPYYNNASGYLQLSDACANYQNIMIRYRGLGCPIGAVPVVPTEFRQAVKNYVAMAQLTVLFARDPQRWGLVLANVKRDHHGGNGPMDAGTWKQAQRRARTLNMKERENQNKYLSAIDAPKY